MSIKNKLYKFRVIVKVRDWILFIRDYNKTHEMKRRYGKNNPDKTFFVIRNYTCEAGWGSILNYVLLQLKYAIDRGYVPIVDMMNYHSAYEEEGDYRRNNVWERYFEQISPFSLTDVYKSKNVILCGNQLTHRGYITDSNREEWLEYMRIFSSYIKLKPEIYDVIVKERDRVQKSGKRILGVLCRGTDYTKLKPLYHYIPYSAEQTVEIIDEMLVDYQQIYLATEDQQIFEVFKHRYADMLDYTKQDRFCSEEVDCYLSEFTKKRCIDVRNKSIDYLKVLYSLASCNSLVGAPCGGTYISMIINGNKYEKNMVLSNGKYE